MASTSPYSRSPLRHKQRGLFLPGLAIAVVIISLIAGAFWAEYAKENVSRLGDQRAELVGARLAALDDAVKTYNSTFFTQIQRQQSAQRNGHTVPASRVRAPTVEDLSQMDLLRQELATPLVYNGRTIGFSIQLSVPTSDCMVPNCNVTSLVSSTAPMVELHDQNTVNVRRAAIAAAVASQGRAGVSLPESPDNFVGKDGVLVAPNISNAPGLIAITNGYDSRGFLEFARRDGSLPMTGDINMQDDSGTRHSFRNVSDVATQTVNAAGRIKTGEYLDLDGPPVMKDTACAKIGLLGSTTAGQLLSCQDFTWQVASPASSEMPPSKATASCTASNAGATKWGVHTSQQEIIDSAGGGTTYTSEAALYVCQYVWGVGAGNRYRWVFLKYL